MIDGIEIKKMDCRGRDQGTREIFTQKTFDSMLHGIESGIAPENLPCSATLKLNLGFSFPIGSPALSFSTCVLLVSRLALVTREELCSNRPKWKEEVANDFHA